MQSLKNFNFTVVLRISISVPSMTGTRLSILKLKWGKRREINNIPFNSGRVICRRNRQLICGRGKVKIIPILACCRAQNCRPRASLLTIAKPRLLLQRDWAEGWVPHFLVWAILAALKPKVLLVAVTCACGSSYWCCSAGTRRRVCAMRTGSSGFAAVDGSLIGAILFLL